MPYVLTRPFLLHFSNGQEQSILALFGDQNAEGVESVMNAATAQHPRQAVLSGCQTVSVWFRFLELRPYGEVVELISQLFEAVKAAGWSVSRAIEGLPETGSSIGDLADTEELNRWDLGFPSSPNVAGYNAAQSFMVVFERPLSSPTFSEEEVNYLSRFMEELGQMVFCHPISLKEE